MVNVENMCGFCREVGFNECALKSIRPFISPHPHLEAELTDRCPQVSENQFQFEDPLADNLTISDETGSTSFTLREFLVNSMLHPSYWNVFVSAVKTRVADPDFPEPVYCLVEEKVKVEGEDKTIRRVEVEFPPKIVQIRDSVLAEGRTSADPKVGSELFNILYLRVDSLLRTEPERITIK